MAQHKSECSFNIDSLGEQKLKIGTISYIGNKVTKPQIMSRELTLAKNDSIPAQELMSTLNFNVRRLLNLQLFSLVNYQATMTTPGVVDIRFEVVEILFWIGKPVVSLADRNFNVWWYEMNHDIGRTNIGATVIRHNFRGRNEEILLGVQLGYNKQFEFHYRIPFIDKKMHQGLGISGLFATGREINYLTDSNKLRFYHNEFYPYQKLQGKVHYTYRKAYAAIHELELSYNKYSITDALFDQNPDYLGGKKNLTFLELNYIFKYNNTDIRVYPLNGLDLKIIASKKGLGIDRQLNRFDLITQSSTYVKLANNISLSAVLRGRLTFPQKSPYFINRAMGFKNEYVRGYEYYVIDGSHYALLRGSLRYKIIDRVWSQNVLRFIKFIPIRVYAKVFDDMGYTYNKFPGNSFLHNRLLNGYGVGLDIVVSYYAKLRIEYSFNHLGENGLFLHSSKE